MLKRAVAVTVIVVGACLSASPAFAASQPPNFVFILTDDQPVGTLGGMPNAHRLAADGTQFTDAIISNPLCCPARASILTGLYSHSNGVYTNKDGDGSGGYPAFAANGNEDRTFAVALEAEGYQTGLFGKYMNGYDGSRQSGWTAFHSFVGGNAKYYDYEWSIDGKIIEHGSDPSDYSTDVAGREANSWLQSLDPAKPFFLHFSPYAPHGPTTPARQDLGLKTRSSYSTSAYNEKNVSDKPRYIRRLPLLEDSDASRFTRRWDLQYATLLAVDRWIGVFRKTLKASGAFEDTYFIFLSDNGQAWGDHRWAYKVVPYERSIKVPFFISGPRARDQRIANVVSNIDVAPTILDLAGVGPHASDGVSLEPVLTGSGDISRSGVLLEHKTYRSRHAVPSYCGFRTAEWMFTRYVHGDSAEEELYDLRKDPYEMRNLARANPSRASSLRDVTYAAGCDPSLVPPP